MKKVVRKIVRVATVKHGAAGTPEASIVAEVLLHIANALKTAAEKFMGTPVAPVEAEPEKEPEAPEVQEPEAGGVEIPTSAVLETMKVSEVAELGKKMGLTGRISKLVVVAIRAISDKTFDADATSKVELESIADAVGAPHKRTKGEAVTEIKKAIKSLSKANRWELLADAPAEEPEADPEQEAPAKPAKAGKAGKAAKPADEPDADEPEDKDEPADEPSGDGTSEAEFAELAKTVAGDEEELEESDCVESMEAWFEMGKPKGANANLMEKCKKLHKAGKWYEAYLVFVSAWLGLSGDKYDIQEADKAYLRGDTVFCNGAPVEDTDIEGVGRDYASGKMFTVNDDQEIVEYKKPRK